MMLPPPECSSISGTAAMVSACAVATLKVKASRRSLVDVVSRAFGMVPPTLLTTMSSLPNASTASAGERGGVLGMGEVGDDDVGAAAGAADLLGDLLELRLGAGRDHHVRTGFGECQRHRGAEAAAGTGHHGDLVVEPESVQDHVFPISFTARHASKVSAARVADFWNTF